MPITTENGAVVPTPSDPYNLTADLLRMAKSLNLPILVSSAQERDNITDKYDGMTVIRTDQGGISQTYSGGVWYGFRASSAAFNIPAVGANSGTTVNITYPPGVFPGVPRTIVSPSSSRLNASVTNMSATGFTAVLDNWTSVASSAGLGVWQAIYGLV